MKFFVLIITILTSFNAFCQSNNMRVDPPNWWLMSNLDTIQIMLYAENISSLDISISKKSPTYISNIVRTENPNYLWVTLDLRTCTKPTKLEFQLAKNSNIVHSFTFPIYQEIDFENQNGFDQSDVIYLITPDRFSDGDKSNNSFPNSKDVVDRNNPLARHGGDLNGILEHLDYIKDIGFTAIWLNPIIENNNSKYSYHGYAATDFYKIDARFGTNEEYKEFVEICHKKGLKVIMDMIHNHCSNEHFWMSDLPSKDWVNKWDKYTQTNHRKATLQDIHASKIDKKTYLDGWFVPTMPDLNQRNQLLSTYLIQNAIWWSLYLKLDGIRMDTYSYPEKNYMKEWVESMNNFVPHVSIVGEEWSTNPAHIAYWQKNKFNADGFSSDLEYLMDFPTNQLLAEALVEKEDWNKGLVRIYESIANDFIYPAPQNLLIFLDNHDMTRGYTTIEEDVELLKLAMIFCMTTRGVPQVYYGTEILMTSPKQRDDGRIRSDYPGGWEGDKINAFSGEGLSDKQIDFRDFLTRLLNARKKEKILHYGKLTHFVPMDGVYVYFRHNTAGEKIMVIINKNRMPYNLDLERFIEFLNKGEIRGVDIISNEKVIASNQLKLDPVRGYIIKLQDK